MVEQERSPEAGRVHPTRPWLSFYSPLWGRDHPSQRYRVTWPLEALSRAQLASYWVDQRWVTTEQAKILRDNVIALKIRDYDHARAEAIARANVMIFHQYAGGWVEDLMDLTERAADGVHTPVFVFDSDDDCEYIDPVNPRFADWGTRNWDGALLNDGDRVVIDGEPVWEDNVRKGGKLFSLANNRKNIRSYYNAARRCDLVTTTTEALANRFRGEGCENVMVVPNGLVVSDFSQFKVDYGDQIRILWQGGLSHFRDLVWIRSALRRILIRHPNVTLVLWGALFPYLARALPAEQLEVIPWKHIDAHRAVLATIGHDINLCCIERTIFNESKSAIKWYESSLMAEPPATIATNFGPYQEITDGENGLLFDTVEEFEDKMEDLITDVELRRGLGRSAKDWVLRNREITKVRWPWYEELCRLADAKGVAKRAVAVPA